MANDPPQTGKKHIIKLLKKHFTTTANNLTKEKTQTDRLLEELQTKKRELEQRDGDGKTTKNVSNAASLSSLPHHGGDDDDDSSSVEVEQKLRELRIKSQYLKEKNAETRKLYRCFISRCKVATNDVNEIKVSEAMAKELFRDQKKPKVMTTTKHPEKRREINIKDTEELSPRSVIGACFSGSEVLLSPSSFHHAPTPKKKNGSCVPSHALYSTVSDGNDIIEMTEVQDETKSAADAAFAVVIKSHERETTTTVDKKTSGVISTTVAVPPQSSSNSSTPSLPSGTVNDCDLSFLSESSKTSEWWWCFAEEATATTRCTDDEDNCEPQMNGVVVSMAHGVLEDMKKSLSDSEDQGESKERWLWFWSEDHRRGYYYEVTSRKVSWEVPSCGVVHDDASTVTIGSMVDESSNTDDGGEKEDDSVKGSTSLPSSETRERVSTTTSTDIDTSFRCRRDYDSTLRRDGSPSSSAAACASRLRIDYSLVGGRGRDADGDISDLLCDTTRFGGMLRQSRASFRKEQVMRRRQRNRRKRIIRRLLWSIVVLGSMVVGYMKWKCMRGFLKRLMMNSYGDYDITGKGEGKEENNCIVISKEATAWKMLNDDRKNASVKETSELLSPNDNDIEEDERNIPVVPNDKKAEESALVITFLEDVSKEPVDTANCGLSNDGKTLLSQDNDSDRTLFSKFRFRPFNPLRLFHKLIRLHPMRYLASKHD